MSRKEQKFPECLNINPAHMQLSVFATPSGEYSCKKKDKNMIPVNEPIVSETFWNELTTPVDAINRT